MKKIVLIVIVLIHGITFLTSASSSKCNNSEIEVQSGMNGSEGSSIQVINAFDSVFFDLSTATIVGNSVEFPVYFRSDDVINALDFAFKYDHTKLEYDTILNMTNYIDALSFYNTLDSTVRLTSYSFSQPYSNDSLLFIVKFTILAGQICSGDLNTVSALLNGDACSHKVVECLNSGINEYDQELFFSMYPNPASDYVIVDLEGINGIEFMDITGKVICREYHFQNFQTKRFDTSKLSTGVYFVKIYIGEKSISGKLLIE